ncbi:VAMP5 protein, partial [Onychorhynchus coronatus]|nr:VAMP5 protein [Onychorhynchus coronatus]
PTVPVTCGHPLSPDCQCPHGPHRPPSSWCPCRRCSPRVPMASPWPRAPCPHSPHVPTVPKSPWSVPVSPESPCPHSPPSLRVPPSPAFLQRLPRVPTVPPHVPCPPVCSQAGLARCQRQAEEVAELMRQNVARAMEREGHLDRLQSRAQDLRQASEAFTRSTRAVTQRQRRGQRRWLLVALGLGLFLLLLLLGLGLALVLTRSPPATATVPTPQAQTELPPSTTGTL